MRLPSPEYRATGRSWFQYCCPYCEDAGYGPDDSFHFGWNPDEGRYKCLRCQAGGQAPVLPEPYGYPVDGLTAAVLPVERSEGRRIMPGYRPLTGRSSSVQARAVWQYLTEERGLSPATIRRRRVGYSVDPRFTFAAMFPFSDGDGRTEFFQARFIHAKGKRNKYWHPPWPGPWPRKSQVLYGLRYLDEGLPPVMVEGVFDACAAPNGLAHLGSAVSRYQAERVARISDRALVVPDGDVSLDSRAVERSRDNLSDAGVDSVVVRLPRGEDPASLGRGRLVPILRPAWRRLLCRPS